MYSTAPILGVFIQSSLLTLWAYDIMFDGSLRWNAKGRPVPIYQGLEPRDPVTCRPHNASDWMCKAGNPNPIQPGSR